MYVAHNMFNASLLPKNLIYIHLAYAGLIELPDFSSHAPNLETVYLYRNSMKYMPSGYLKGMIKLKQLDLSHNKLTTVPDLYHLHMTLFNLANNPLECNQSLCWIRMWPWMKHWIKPSVVTDKPICASPPFLNGMPLMEVRPIDIQCYKGKSAVHPPSYARCYRFISIGMSYLHLGDRSISQSPSAYRGYPAKRALSAMRKHGG